MKKKIEFSKIIVVIVFILFAVCLYNGLTIDVSEYTDLSVVLASITITGAMLTGIVSFYLKKAQVENSVKLKTEMYKVAVNEKINYTKEMIKLKNEYSLTDEELSDIENESPMESFETGALYSIDQTIENNLSDGETSVEIQTY